MKARNKIIGLGITLAALAVSPQANAQVNPGPNNTITGTYSSVAGGDWSQVSGNYSTVAGGFTNSASGEMAFVGGGRSNHASGPRATVAGGTDNIATGSWPTIGGGANNRATNSSTFIGGGAGNIASGSHATVAGGAGNTASASQATVPGGASANASHYGQFAYASGSFAADGDAQASMYVLRATTTSSTQTELFLDGSAARMTIASGRTLVFEIQVVARSSGNTSAAYLIKGAIDNNSGTTSFLNAPIVEVLGEDNAAWDATVQADDTNDALVLKVTGAASTTIRWVATVRTTEVGH